jgi:hypothetical protein
MFDEVPIPEFSDMIVPAAGLLFIVAVLHMRGRRRSVQ